MAGSFCPFVHGPCRADCVFRKSNPTSSELGLVWCLMALKLSDINGMQFDQLSEISSALDRRT